MSIRQFVLSVFAFTFTTSLVCAQGNTEFSFQGRLMDAGAPADGRFDFEFSLWDDSTAGVQIGTTNSFTGMTVLEGLFTVDLDFGANAFNNNDRWLEITVDGIPLLPRQPINRTPYSIQTRGIMVNEDGEVGIGTDTPGARLHVQDNSNAVFGRAYIGGLFETNDPTGQAVYGFANTATGSNYAFYGLNTSLDGTAVYGHAISSEGTTYGGRFTSDSTSGRAVYGWASATSGTTYGGRFENYSTGGRGVYGVANASTGENYGGRFVSLSSQGIGASGEVIRTTGLTIGLHGLVTSTNGRAVYGEALASTGSTFGGEFVNSSGSGIGVSGVASAATGTTYGVHGTSNATGGTGVFGRATATGGLTYGGLFESFSTDGSGVVGTVDSTNGTTYGVRGVVNSSSGVAVFGSSTAASGFSYGGRFTSNSTSGVGVFGVANATTGTARGGRFFSYSTNGVGVNGTALATSGSTFGVTGVSASTSGYGVWGQASATSGTNYGVYGESLSTSGYAGFFRGKGNDALYVINDSDGRALRAVAPEDTAIWAQSTNGFAGVHGQNGRETGRALYGEATSSTGVNFGVYGRSNSSSGYDFYAGGAGVNYGASSSRRWKNNIITISDPLQKLSLLRGVYFDWDEDHGGAHDVGMIAEEVGKVLPEVVQFEANGIDASGMDYSKMSPLLVEAVKALRAEKDAEIAALQKRLDEMEELVQKLITANQNHE